MVGDEAALRTGAVFIRHHRQPAILRQLLSKGVQRVGFHQIAITGYAVQERYRTLATLCLQGMEHGEQRRQAGATRQHEQRAFAAAQIEAAHRPAEGQAIAGLRPLRQPLAHHAARHVTNKEVPFEGTRLRAK